MDHATGMIHFELQIRIAAWKELHTNAAHSMKKSLSALTLAGMMGLGVATGGGENIPYKTGTPDLVPVAGSPVFRHIAAKRKVASEPFCHGMFAQATTTIVRTITVGDLSWGVRNSGPVAVTTPFTVQLRRSGVIVDNKPVQILDAGATMTFSYHRAQSQTEVSRLGLVPNAEMRQTYNATGGECVQTIGQPAQYDWQDPQWEIRVDPANAVGAETNKTNNKLTF